MATNTNTFYVYEHWRLDRDECFYVGKGKGRRAYSRSGRNSHWGNIVAKLERIGSGYEIRMVAVGITEQEAFELEARRIDFWRDIVDLCNKTKGGEGVSGLVMSDEAKRKMSEKAKGRVGNKSMLGKKHSEETKEKMRLAKLGKAPNNAGKKYSRKPLSAEHRAKLSLAKKGLRMSDEARSKLSELRKIRPINSETRAKLSASARKQWADPLKRPRRGKILAGD